MVDTTDLRSVDYIVRVRISPSALLIFKELKIIKKCKTHPKYKAINSPRCDCEVCWNIYNEKNEIISKELEKLSEYNITEIRLLLGKEYKKSPNKIAKSFNISKETVLFISKTKKIN